MCSRFRGVREGGFGDGSSYWVFVKAVDGVFHAFPVTEWYNFVPVARYKTLDIDEAEEQFLKFVFIGLRMGGKGTLLSVCFGVMVAFLLCIYCTVL